MMGKPLIALFGRKADPQIHAIRDAVTAMGGEPLVFQMQLDDRLAPAMSIGAGRMSWEGVDFAPVRALYIRGMAPNSLPALPPVLNAAMQAEWRARYIRDQLYQSASYSFFGALQAQGTLVVNPLETYSHHNSKAQFYERLRADGFDVPFTLTTNDPAEARAFAEKWGRVVVKPGIGVGSTRILREDQMRQLDEISISPTTMQECVPGKTYRVHIVGDTVVLALKILNDEIDSRTETRGFEYAKLPDEEERKIVRANRSLGLHFAAWDVIVTEAGRISYLDCNPGPFLMWIGPENVRAVYGQLARYLIAYAETGSVADASKRVEPHRPA